jgi:anaphase-promoting complex subunit 6
LDKQGELYYIAHKLVSANPDSAISWYAVGSYYFLIKKYPQARKYFQKANNLDKNFAASWIAFGHSFAAQDESEQAMAAYRSAARLFPGCHLANLFIGMEYLRMNNLQTAIDFFKQAKEICPNDPLIFNEIGVCFYKLKDYDQAQENLGIAMSFCKDTNSQTYESVLLNLAHCHRKNKEYESAVSLYEQCLAINSGQASTLAALGFTLHQMGEVQEALNYYHKAHFINGEDSMLETLVQKAMEDIHDFPIDESYFRM